MVLSMPRPFKHPKTGVYYFRQKTPVDLRAIFGKGEAGWSLGTKDPEEAKRLNAGAVQQQAAVWDRLRKRPEPLPHKQIVALSGTLYRDLMATLETEPGEPSIWVEVLKLLDRVASAPDGREKWYGPEADRLMVEHGIVTDAASRTRMLIELDKALRQAAEQQLKRAEGDYSPDPKADRFPTPESSRKVAATSKPEGQTIRGVFKLWERDHLAEGKSPKTVVDFRQKIESLITFVGHDVARDVTSDNVAEWCEHLRHKEEIGARTVSQKYLAAVKVVFGLAVEKRKLTENPAKDIKVRFKKPSKVRPKGFTDAEAVSILKAALSDPEHFGARSEVNKRAIRWVPWICAFTGARVTEVNCCRAAHASSRCAGGPSTRRRRRQVWSGHRRSCSYSPRHGRCRKWPGCHATGRHGEGLH